MKHYLNTELRGKTDSDGNTYFPVYIKFSVNSQTYKYKSQLVRRLLSLEEYGRLEEIYQGDGISTLLQKERDIVKDLVKQCIIDGKFIQKEFKEAYNAGIEHNDNKLSSITSEYLFDMVTDVNRFPDNKLKMVQRTIKELKNINKYKPLSEFEYIKRANQITESIFSDLKSKKDYFLMKDLQDQ